MLSNYEIEKEFREDSRDKKITARSARKRVGLRRGCNFTYRTPCEQRAMNGPCITYNLNVPMDWDGFQNLPKHIQTQYISSLNSRFGANQDMVAAMLQVEGAEMEQFKHLFKENAGPDLTAWDTFLATPTEAPQTDEDRQDAERNKLAAALQAFRQKRGLSTSTLAAAFSLTSQTIRSYERGDRTLSHTKEFAQKVADWGRTTVDDMLAAAGKSHVLDATKAENADTAIQAQEALRLGKAIRMFRTERGMSIKQLAKELSVAGSTVSNYESGSRTLGSTQAFTRKVAAYGHTTISEMLDAVEKMKMKPLADAPAEDVRQRTQAMLNILYTMRGMNNRMLAEELGTTAVSISRARYGKVSEEKASALLEKLQELHGTYESLLADTKGVEQEPAQTVAPAPQMGRTIKLMGSPATVLLAVQALMAQTPSQAQVSVQVSCDSSLPLPLLEPNGIFRKED